MNARRAKIKKGVIIDYSGVRMPIIGGGSFILTGALHLLARPNSINQFIDNYTPVAPALRYPISVLPRLAIKRSISRNLLPGFWGVDFGPIAGKSDLAYKMASLYHKFLDGSQMAPCDKRKRPLSQPPQ